MHIEKLFSNLCKTSKKEKKTILELVYVFFFCILYCCVFCFSAEFRKIAFNSFAGNSIFIFL